MMILHIEVNKNTRKKLAIDRFFPPFLALNDHYEVLNSVTT